MPRLFFGLQPKQADKANISHWREQLNWPQFKPVEANNFHLTLNFLGSVKVEKIAELLTAAEQIKVPAFSVKLTTLGYWQHPKVLFLGTDLIAANLTKLVDSLNCMIKDHGIIQPVRPYIPHLTLFRNARYLPEEDVIKTFSFDLEFTDFCLYQSISTDNGVKYVVLKSWPLVYSANSSA